MEKDETWIVCKHVMDGTAWKVQVRRDKVCMCISCSEDPTMLKTNEIYVLDEPLLVERLKKIDNEHNEKGENVGVNR